VALPIEDVVALHNLQRMYTHYVTVGDAGRYLSLFTDDAVWERVVPGVGTDYHEPLRLEGIGEIRERMSGHFPAPFELEYISVNPLVDGSSDEAWGSATLLIYAMQAGKPDLSAVVNASDRYQKQSGIWKFASRELRFFQ
jgi:hypothetical protein